MRFHNITKNDMLNGDGLRVVLWLSGCEHHCEGCQNPITWNANDGLVFDENAKQEIFTELDKDYISGITFSGGDPLLCATRKEVGEFVKEVRQKYPNKTIWMYTGYDWDAVKDLDLMKDVDVLVDGRFVLALKDDKLEWKGSSNQRVIDVKSTLKNGEVVLH